MPEEIGIITTFESGVDVVFEWKIEDFFNLPMREGTYYWSPELSFGGERWHLGIFPNGWSLNDSSGHVDLNLCKRPSNCFIEQSFSLSLKTAKGEKCNEQHFTKDFGNNFLGHYHDLLRFTPRLELTRRRSELVPEGVLTVVCTVKNTAAAGSTSEACAPGSSTSPYEKKVVQDLKKFFLQKEDCDVIIKVKGSEIPAHRVILKARSPVFASTFRHNMKENATGVVEIEDCEPGPFSDFLRFLYCGDVGMISQENVFSLFTLADKYEVMDLKAKCLDFMKNNLTVTIFCDTITLALLHSETELITLATDFFVKNAEEILPTDKWQTFVVENPKRSNEFMKFVKSVKHSNT